MASTEPTPPRDAATPGDMFHPLAFRHLDPEPWDNTPQNRLFEYEPLKLPRHIRLLKINNFELLASKNWAATEPPDPPTYEMVQVPVDSVLTYTALSYTWGLPTRTHALVVSGAPLLITASLAEALGVVPRIAPSEYLWIDQVCINQADDKEKNHQVQIMGEIYSNSHKVIIWTGEEIKGLRLAVDTYLPPGRAICEDVLDWEILDKLCDVDASPLHRLLLRPWFRRAWVVQEAVLAKVAVVVAGSCQLTIEELCWTMCWPSTFLGSGEESATKAEFYSSKIVLDTIFGLRHPTKNGTATFRGADRGFDSLIMDSLGRNHTSDPRDHVYAFLGFQKDPNVSIVPDYSLSVAEAFTRAASALIQGTNSLELLRFLPNNSYGSHISAETRTELPSWVPDWSGRTLGYRILRDSSAELYGHTSTFDAAKGVPHRPNHAALVGGSKLVASGCIIDGIASMLSSADRLELVEDRPRFFGLTDEEVTALDPTAISDPTQKLRKRIVVMLTGGCIGVAPPGVEEVLKRYDEEKSPLPSDVREPVQWFTGRNSELSDYTPVRTEKNKLGLVPKTACVGDLVVILHGFQVPIVLRPTEGGTYAVVGQCYLEDAMFGEAVTWEEDEADEFTLV